MALQKNIDTAFGIPAVYWRVVEAREVFVEGALHIKLFGYLTKEARDAGKACIADIHVTFEGDKYKPSMSREEVYGLLKTLPEFAGALDV